ncbi:MAG: hypothetical protein HN742_09110 [Lentisphaerae bacterium]|jgi:phosphoglycerate dehydrogenase-like enzyme|nr:hypothetical protein [Lentisphaerota bacterium]MBT4816604.1 hypothetical protein [Lentisphaerota bacterium]MBT5610948.1 hypothetical protein [Lentisphaerota bacterium]MBT7053640.1 hypothetical protein [Lentisphaerota bacterium]MBT7842019.1 hypothetical protein [Lentisphaerota bacterium]
MPPIPVVITEPEYRKAQDAFDSSTDVTVTVVAPDEDAVVKGIEASQAWAAILGVEHYAEALYSALPRGGIIARFGVGHDGIDKRKASDSGLFVTNTPGVLEGAVAEHTLALMLGLVKGISDFSASVAEKRWCPKQTSELRGKRLAVLGCGAIGRQVARTAAYGFGMDVVGLDVVREAEDELRANWGVARFTTDFADAVAEANIISLHVPATAENHHLIRMETISLFAPGAMLINTARGAIIDEISLYDALRNGALAAAALDVFESEPYTPRTPEKDLRELPNVLLTPHVSSATREACNRVAEAALRNVREARAGNVTALDLLNSDMIS